MSNQRRKIFIIDDEALLSEMLSDYLLKKQPRLSITSFLTGEACLEQIDEKPALIILDYFLNSEDKNAANGLEILKKIRKYDPTLPVIMLSSQENYVTAAQTIGHGAMHYVIKGQDAFEEIEHIIRANR